jgi:hypothetical protein
VGVVSLGISRLRRSVVRGARLRGLTTGTAPGTLEADLLDGVREVVGVEFPGVFEFHFEALHVRGLVLAGKRVFIGIRGNLEYEQRSANSRIGRNADRRTVVTMVSRSPRPVAFSVVVSADTTHAGRCLTERSEVTARKTRVVFRCGEA